MNNKWYKSRLGKYLIYGIFYILLWKLSGDFETTVIIALGQIMAETTITNENNNDE